MTQFPFNRRSFLLTGIAMLAYGPPAHAHNGKVHVVIEKLGFVPAEIAVRAGDIIEWTNKDPFAHTASVKGGWEVIIPPGAVATHVATGNDTIDYYCRFHPNMTGRIKVVP